MKLIEWRGFEAELLIERFRLCVLCMNNQRSQPADVRSLQGPQQGVFEKSLADALSLLDDVHGQSRKEHDGDRMSGQPFADSWRGGFMLDAAKR